MDNDLKSLWEKTLNIIKGEMSEVSFNTWIKSCEPISISSNTIKISVPNSFTQDILEKRYKDLVVNSIEAACAKVYKVEFIVASDVQEAEEREEKKSNFDDKVSITVNDEMSSTLNPKYTFDSFVIGNSNRFAHAASLAVAESPAKAYNPLFIYGGVGLGKTHLMHAIGHYVLQNNSSAKVVYVSSEKFTNELI
ncbi:chromosomal replication initiator protein DnaA, partial [Clostridium perfringens]